MAEADSGRRRNRDLRIWERRLAGRGFLRVAGVDEAGRGPLAGPVVAAAVWLPPDRRWRGLDDSKLLPAEQRETLYRRLTSCPEVDWAVGAASVEEIDRFNILQAALTAMVRALHGLRRCPDHVLVDGNQPVPGWAGSQTSLIQGDGRCRSIAAASILAKVTRDRWMEREAERLYPGYGFAAHKGYPTPAHRDALQRLGPCPLHRRTFRPVRWLTAAAEQQELSLPWD